LANKSSSRAPRCAAIGTTATSALQQLIGVLNTAAGYYGRSAVLLIAWVAAFALIRGVRDIVLAFRVREVQHAAPART
jgi:uncharacterized membrane protein HdeD (DUF308 family)